jgi:hypothetical protein
MMGVSVREIAYAASIAKTTAIANGVQIAKSGDQRRHCYTCRSLQHGGIKRHVLFQQTMCSQSSPCCRPPGCRQQAQARLINGNKQSKFSFQSAISQFNGNPNPLI